MPFLEHIQTGWNMDPLLLVGLAVFIGFFGARGAKYFKTPQVVGYVLIGVLFNLFRLFDFESAQHYEAICNLVLGFIGFGIGSELKVNTLKKLSNVIFTIVAFEAISTFLLVFGLLYLMTQNIALALVLGALASATAPAGTVDVLQEYKAKGSLTTILYAVVALDDAASLIIYGFVLSLVRVMYSPGGTAGVLGYLLMPLVEILLSIGCGVIFGLLVARLLKNVRKETDALVIGVSAVLLCSGVAATFHLSMILANMAMGMMLINLAPFASRRAFQAMKNFTPPMYILFFVLVGARLNLLELPQMGFIGLVYILARTAGKWAGAYIGATVSGAETKVRRYLGFGLFSQAGVAIGLALSFYNELSPLGPQAHQLGFQAVSIITATTIVVQLLGPPMVKKAIFSAGEATQND
jgi:NhaP-type Na+/H+ or K+/H+ antiporter